MKKIETYRGIDIWFNRKNEKYFFKVILPNSIPLKTKNINALKSKIDLLLKAIPVNKKNPVVWLKGDHVDCLWKRVELLFINKKTNTATIRMENLKIETIPFSLYPFAENALFLDSKHNNNIISQINNKKSTITLLKNEIKEMSDNLMSLK